MTDYYLPMPNNVQNFLSARAHHLSTHSRAAAQETAAHCQEALWLLKCSKEDQRGQNPGWVPNPEGKPLLTVQSPLCAQIEKNNIFSSFLFGTSHFPAHFILGECLIFLKLMLWVVEGRVLQFQAHPNSWLS